MPKQTKLQKQQLAKTPITIEIEPDKSNVIESRKGMQVGSPGYGGRPQGAKNVRLKRAQEIADELGVDPIRFMLEVIDKPALQLVKVNPITGETMLDDNGKPVLMWMACTMDMKMDAAKSVAKYIHPTLAATQIVGDKDNPITVQSANLSVVMSDPKLLEMAQMLALSMAQQPEPSDTE